MIEYRLSTMTEADKKSVLARGGTDVSEAVSKARAIIEAVKRDGDSSLLGFAKEFDNYSGTSLSVSEKEIADSVRDVPKETLEALEVSRKRIEEFHSRQKLASFEFGDLNGVYGQRVVPLERVGVYVPGGTAAYMSSVLMACIPAKVAGVKEISICTPAKGSSVSSEILAAAHLCGVTEVHPVGGAHAIAALAYGTRSVRRVQKIVGPGSMIVSAAKLLVRSDCEIDFLAGPSEVLIIADSKTDPQMIAWDMLAQLEHDPMARAVLVSASEAVAAEAKTRLEKLVARTPRKAIASKAAERGAIFIIADSIEQAVEFSNEYAPEHLLIDSENPKAVLGKVTSAGSVFLGRWSSVVFGDYCSGPNHILPTVGTASMKSSLSVYDFLKLIPYQSINRDGAAKLSKVVDVLARAEGLPAHADAAAARARWRMS
jgi:histidinol dehydrogenase